MSIPDDVDAMLKSGYLMKGSDPRLTIRRLPTKIPGFDELLGGGFPAGRYTQIVGPESTGKSLLAQYAAASQQDQEKSLVLLMDMERSFDDSWWAASGVDVDALLVSQPMHGEEAVDIMLAVIKAEEARLGMIILDSAAAMFPRAMTEPEKGSEQKFMGNQSTMIKQMFAMLTPQIDDIVFIIINQMRSNIGGYEEIYPGGWAMRHYNHVTLRTRREGWLKDGNTRIGFLMEVINKKNKVGGVQDASIQIPVKFMTQIDMMQSYLDEATEKKIVYSKGPYYYWGEAKFLGKNAMRQHFMEKPEDFEKLKEQLGA